MNELLKQYIDKSGLKIKFIADQLDLTYPGLYNKLTGKTEFSDSEATKIRELLHISDDDWSTIWLKKKY